MQPRTPLVLMQDMRVQAFRCSTNDSSPAPTLSQDAPPSHQTQPHPHHTKPPHGSSSDWVSRTAALTASMPRPPPCNPDPINDAPSLPTNIFTSDTALQNGTDRQDAAAPLPDARAASPAEGGALIGSSAMADSHCGVVVALALCGAYVCSAGGDAMIKVWKADSLEFVRYSATFWPLSCLICCLAHCHIASHTSPRMLTSVKLRHSQSSPKQEMASTMCTGLSSTAQLCNLLVAAASVIEQHNPISLWFGGYGLLRMTWCPKERQFGMCLISYAA